MRGSKPTILVVDDEPNVLLTVCAILETEGYETEGAPDGGRAISILQQRHFDLVLTDLKMPGVDGLGVLAEVQRSAPGTVTVMMTGYGSVDSAIDAIRFGAYEYLLKPIDVPELKVAVARALERKRLSEIDTLYHVSQVLSRAVDPTAISQQVCVSVQRVLGVAHAEMFMLNRDGAVAKHRPFILDGGDREFATVILPQMLERLSHGGVVTTQNCPESVGEWARASGIASFVFQPGIAAGRLVCVLLAHNNGHDYDFHNAALRFLGGIANQGAVALENAQLIAELKKQNVEIATANEKLRELDRLKSQFLASATHELRTPLSVMLGYNTMLAESLDGRLNEDERKTLSEATSACARLVRLVDSMLDISQIQSGKVPMSFADCSVSELANGIVALFRFEASRKGVALQASVPRELPTVRMDAEKIQQVLINLVANALKFTPPGGTVDVSAQVRKGSGQLELSVHDTGVGIAPEHHETIFQEFSRVPESAAAGQGSGLGLSIAKHILEAHKGDIHVDSEIGKGSTFTIALPLSASSASNAVPA